MKRLQKRYLIGFFLLIFIIYLNAIAVKVTVPPVLKGFYQSEWVSNKSNSESKIIQISIWEDGKFIEFITNRQVNQGTFKKMDDVQYHFNEDEADIDIILGKDNSFEIEIPKS